MGRPLGCGLPFPPSQKKTGSPPLHRCAGSRSVRLVRTSTTLRPNGGAPGPPSIARVAAKYPHTAAQAGHAKFWKPGINIATCGANKCVPAHRKCRRISRQTAAAAAPGAGPASGQKGWSRPAATPSPAPACARGRLGGGDVIGRQTRHARAARDGERKSRYLVRRKKTWVLCRNRAQKGDERGGACTPPN